MQVVSPVLAGAESAATSSVGDPGATRTVYTIVVVLVLLAAALLYFAFRFWQRTRPGDEYVRPASRTSRSGQSRSPGRPDPERRPEPSRRADPARRPAASRGPDSRRGPEPHDRPTPRPSADPSADPFEDDPWWDTRAPRPRPKPSLRDPLL